jgi:hypothetical protein
MCTPALLTEPSVGLQFHTCPILPRGTRPNVARAIAALPAKPLPTPPHCTEERPDDGEHRHACQTSQSSPLPSGPRSSSPALPPPNRDARRRRMRWVTCRTFLNSLYATMSAMPARAASTPCHCPPATTCKTKPNAAKRHHRSICLPSLAHRPCRGNGSTLPAKTCPTNAAPNGGKADQACRPRRARSNRTMPSRILPTKRSRAYQAIRTPARRTCPSSNCQTLEPDNIGLPARPRLAAPCASSTILVIPRLPKLPRQSFRAAVRQTEPAQACCTKFYPPGRTQPSLPMQTMERIARARSAVPAQPMGYYLDQRT